MLEVLLNAFTRHSLDFGSQGKSAATLRRRTIPLAVHHADREESFRVQT